MPKPTSSKPSTLARTPSGSNALYLVLHGEGGGKSHPRGHHEAQYPLHLGQKEVGCSSPAPCTAG